MNQAGIFIFIFYILVNNTELYFLTWPEERAGERNFSRLFPLLKRTLLKSSSGHRFSWLSSSSSLRTFSQLFKSSTSAPLATVEVSTPAPLAAEILVTSARTGGGRRAVLTRLMLMGLTPQSSLNSAFRWRIFSANSCSSQYFEIKKISWCILYKTKDQSTNIH